MVYFWWSDIAILSNLRHHSWHFWTQKSGERSLIAMEKASIRGQLPYPQESIWKTERVNPPHSKDDGQVLLAVTQKGKQTQNSSTTDVSYSVAELWQIMPSPTANIALWKDLRVVSSHDITHGHHLMTSSRFQCSSARLIKTGLCVLINSIPFEEEPLNNECNKTFRVIGLSAS